MQDTNRGLMQRCTEAETQSGRTEAIVETLQQQQVGIVWPPARRPQSAELQQYLAEALNGQPGPTSSRFKPLL